MSIPCTDLCSVHVYYVHIPVCVVELAYEDVGIYLVISSMPDQTKVCM